MKQTYNRENTARSLFQIVFNPGFDFFFYFLITLCYACSAGTAAPSGRSYDQGYTPPPLGDEMCERLTGMHHVNWEKYLSSVGIISGRMQGKE